MSRPHDLAVIGGGPAGAAAALAAARAGLSVALFEPQAPRADKPCGEGILPAGVAALRALGLETVLARGRLLERIRYVLRSGRELAIDLPDPACALERPVLMAALDGALALEPRVVRIARHVTAERGANGFVVRSGAEAWPVRTLIAADGLQGRAAAWLRAPPRDRGRHGLRARAEARRPLPEVEVHLGGASELYLTPLAGGRVNVAVLRDGLSHGARTSASALAAALAEHPRAAEALGACLTPPETRALPRTRPRRAAADAAFLAGDAAGGIDPVLGCGVALALVTGPAAARAAARVLARGSGAPEREYDRLVARETALRRTLADALRFLARHPGLQASVARLFAAWPGGTALVARAVAGSTAAGV